MNTTINEIYALISIVLIVIILLFGFGLWLASKAANTIFNTLNNKINTLENITFERLMLIEEQNNQFLQDMYLPVMETFGKEGWDDPAMDIYNDLDPRRQS
jgi:hypothetical protein